MSVDGTRTTQQDNRLIEHIRARQLKGTRTYLVDLAQANIAYRRPGDGSPPYIDIGGVIHLLFLTGPNQQSTADVALAEVAALFEQLKQNLNVTHQSE